MTNKVMRMSSQPYFVMKSVIWGMVHLLSKVLKQP
jgi:hypothetical protein